MGLQGRGIFIPFVLSTMGCLQNLTFSVRAHEESPPSLPYMQLGPQKWREPQPDISETRGFVWPEMPAGLGRLGVFSSSAPRRKGRPCRATPGEQQPVPEFGAGSRRAPWGASLPFQTCAVSCHSRRPACGLVCGDRPCVRCRGTCSEGRHFLAWALGSAGERPRLSPRSVALAVGPRPRRTNACPGVRGASGLAWAASSQLVWHFTPMPFLKSCLFISPAIFKFTTGFI